MSAALTLLMAAAVQSRPATDSSPFVLVLGIAQDGGAPQAGCARPCCTDRDGADRRHVACIAIVDPATSQRWLIDATPDLPAQLQMLDAAASPPDEVAAPGLAGIFLTHAHMGHYTGLMHLGHEVMGARGVPVWAMPRMRGFLASNGPWDQLVTLHNIDLRELAADHPVVLSPRVRVTPLIVPHRDEYSETVGYRIDGPARSLLYIPDIDKWSRWERSIETLIADVDVALLDGTFFDDQELPGRDMSEIPHPFMVESLERFASLPKEHRAGVHFIHLNHTNPALVSGSDARKTVEAAGMHVAEELQRFAL